MVDVEEPGACVFGYDVVQGALALGPDTPQGQEYTQGGAQTEQVLNLGERYTGHNVGVRIFVHTDIRSHTIFDRAERPCTYQMTTPDIRTPIKLPPRMFVHLLFDHPRCSFTK